MTRDVATAFAPASVANLAVGFDLLGFAIGGYGDRVRVRHASGGHGIRLGAVSGILSELPSDPSRNTATAAVLAMAEDRDLPSSLLIDVHKGIPLGSGMGGSAASAVAAVVAANALLDAPASSADLLAYAVAGERVASGSAHADNVAPSLIGGMVAVVGMQPPTAVSLPVPSELVCVLVHPHLEIETRAARAVLSPDVPLQTHVRQSQHLAGFLAGCYTNDLALLGRSMVDLVAEPARADLIPGYREAKSAALTRGAISFSISGAGPSVFAFATSSSDACAVDASIREVFAANGLGSESWVGPIAMEGAHVIEPDVSFLAEEGG